MENRHALVVDCRVTLADGFAERDAPTGGHPHVAQNRARSGGYAKSINARLGIEKIFGWLKGFSGLRQFKLRGQENVSGVFGLHLIAYNLIRLGNIL